MKQLLRIRRKEGLQTLLGLVGTTEFIIQVLYRNYIGIINIRVIWDYIFPYSLLPNLQKVTHASNVRFLITRSHPQPEALFVGSGYYNSNIASNPIMTISRDLGGL